jgi:hypothetical protein
VNDALAPVFASGASACLVPDAQADVPHYVMLLAGVSQETAEALCSVVEARLDGIFHYAHARRIGQLGPLRVRRVAGAHVQLGDLLQHAAERSGIRAGDVKPGVLVTRLPMAALLLRMNERWPHE